MKQSLDELSTLNRIASAINVSMSLDHITKTIVDHCCRRVKSEQGAIFLLEQEDTPEERFKTFVRDTSTEGLIPFHLNLSLQGWMLKHRSILLSNDPDNDDRIHGSNYAKGGLRHILAAPLLSRKGLLGVLTLINKGSEDGFTSQDQRFLGIVGTQVSKVIENARLFERETVLAEMEKEMGVARIIQKGFLPQDNAVSEGFEILGYNDSAKAVGGDYYDILKLSDSRVFFSLGDVSGKGLPAALLTGNAQAVMRSRLHGSELPDLEELADCLNKLIYNFTSSEQYITAIFGIYDHDDKTISYINAGHLPPLVVSRDGEAKLPSDADLVIGVLPEVKFNTIKLSMKPGDKFCIYTDGISEAFNEAQEQFGEKRFEKLMVDHRDKSARELIDQILKELADYRGLAEQSDDITVLLVEVK
ncbi:MAG: SpoIIE family protein phosphatase [bacterium]|nr:SpoIIE family protein phosphatase [bacterium]